MRKLFNLICNFWRKFSRQQEEEVYLSNIRECVKISMKGACPDLDLLVHHYDEDPDKARLKAESKYHEVLAAAAVSNTMSHAAILFSSEGFPIMHQCYKHEVVNPAPEPTPEEVTDGE
jgi:deferrochelatase/peroxidase EfeB